MVREKKQIGIIGGMGPLATCDLMQKIILNTKAGCDQEHLHIYVDNNTRIPDRTRAILQGGEDPTEQMLESARKLEAMGAEILIMPCNTAHFFYNRIAAGVSAQVLHMPRETAALLRSQGIRRAGVLATEGTVRSGIYEAALAEQGIEGIYPDEADQALLTELIYTYVKAGKSGMDRLPIPQLKEHMRQKGAQVLILGCTELPIAFAQLNQTDGTVDPTLVLARSAIRAAGGETL